MARNEDTEIVMMVTLRTNSPNPDKVVKRVAEHMVLQYPSALIDIAVVSGATPGPITLEG